MNILHLDSSILGDASVSRQLGRELVSRWQQQDPALQLVQRDVGSELIPLLDGRVLAAGALEPALRTPFQQAQAELNGELIAELSASDVLLIAAPMYNFSIPANLRAWFDRVLAAGKTFRYTEHGPQGLLQGKRAILILTAGGLHSQTPVNQMHEGYLRTLLAFIGITEVDVVRAEGLSMGSEQRQRGLARARHDMEQLLAASVVAA